MNRDIRYRIRLKAVGKGAGYEVGEVVTIFNDIFNKQNGVAFFQLNKDWEVLSADQFTGLKDKNNNDIYESDIVIAYEYSINEDFEKTDEVLSTLKATVIWDNDFLGWAIKSEQLESLTYPMAHMDKFEIIGNIYETPELLK